MFEVIAAAKVHASRFKPSKPTRMNCVMEIAFYPENASEQELAMEAPPIWPKLLVLPQPGENDESLDLVGSDFLLGC